MFGHKYMLSSVEEFGEHNPVTETILGKTCYLSYFRQKQRGVFLVDTEDEWGTAPHRIITSVVNHVQCDEEESVIVETENTRYTFVVVE